MATVRDVLIFITGNKDAFDKTAKEATAEADKLDHKKVNIKIVADAVGALSKIEAVKASVLRVTAAEQRLNELRSKEGVPLSQITRAEAALSSARAASFRSNEQLEKIQRAAFKTADEHTRALGRERVGWLGLAGLLSPVIIPALAGVAAGAIGAGAGLGVLALAVLGAKQQMAAGTATGKQFSAGLSVLKGDLAGLAGTAAVGMLAAFSGAVAGVHSQIGPLNAEVAKLSPAIGSGLSSVIAGLLSLMIRLGPLAEQVAQGFAHGAQSFASWAAHSDGPTKLVAFMSRELPKVVNFVESTARAFGRLIEAAGPMGGVMLSTLTALAKVISAIPLPILQVLVPVLVSLGLALKALAVADVISTKVDRLKVAFEGLDTGAMLGVGAIAALAYAIGSLLKGPLDQLLNESGGFAKAFAGVGNNVDTFKQALIDSKGAVDGNVRSVAALALQHTTFSAILQKTGVSLADQTTALTGSDKQFNQLFNTLQAGGSVSNTVLIAFKVLRDEFVKGKISAADYVATMGALGGASAASATQIDALNKQIAQTRATSLSATAQLGYLNAALDVLSNNAISAEQDQLHLKDAMANFTAQVKANGTSLSENTAKGRQNKESLIDLISQANAHAAAKFKETGSIDKATGALRTDETAIRNAAAAAGLNKDQVDKLVKSYAAVPSDVETKVKANIRQAENQIIVLEDEIAALQLQSHIITITTYLQKVILPDVRKTYSQNATGGLIRGPGTGTSDSILTRVSAGEFVVPADMTAKYLPLLQQMQAGTAAVPGNGMRSGGLQPTAGGDIYVTVNVAGSVKTENDLLNSVVHGIDRARRRKGLRGLVDSPGAPIRGVMLDDTIPQAAL